MKEITIKVADKEYVFRFGLGFLGRVIMSENTDAQTLLQNASKNPFYYIPILMNESAKYSAERRKVEHTMTREDFEDIIDETGGLNSKLFLDFYNAFNASFTENVPTVKATKKGPGRPKK